MTEESNYDFDADAGVPKGEGTPPGEATTPTEDRLARHLPGFDDAEVGTAIKVMKYEDGASPSSWGDYDGGPDDRIGELFQRDTGNTVELLGDFNGHAVYRFVQRVDGWDAANDHGSVYMVAWSRWHDHFEHIGGDE